MHDAGEYSHAIGRETVRQAEAVTNDATLVRIEAQAKAGDVLTEMAKTGERDSGKGGSAPSRASTVKLQDLGVSRDESSRWQQVAAVPAQAPRANVRRCLERWEMRASHARACCGVGVCRTRVARGPFNPREGGALRTNARVGVRARWARVARGNRQPEGGVVIAARGTHGVVYVP